MEQEQLTDLAADNPARLLWQIDQQVRRYASPLPQRIELKANWEGIAFRIFDTPMVVSVEQVAEILLDFRVTVVPGVKAWVLGVANVRGVLLPMLDLPTLLGDHSRVALNRKKVFIVNHAGMSAGLCIDEVIGIRRFDEGDYQRGDGGVTLPQLRTLIQGSYRDNDDRQWPVVDLYRLMEQDEFLQIAA
ncbi:chemotaxis protein CheW [Ectothiorhodospiraceae bacterium BW-2]|nr:chemotaxis protein CheW [Ectothiorhodospiraceae bacterium BW-2]